MTRHLVRVWWAKLADASLRRRSMAFGLTSIVIAGSLLVGSFSDSPRRAEAAGGFRMVVIGLAADSAPVQPTPNAWVFFVSSHYLTVTGFRYSIHVVSQAPVLTTERFPGRKQWGDGPSVGGPYESAFGCTLVSDTEVIKTPLRTHGLLLPPSGLPGEIQLALEPATYKGTANFSCPSAPGQPPPAPIDTIFWWILFHADDFSGPAGSYILGEFTVPHVDERDCVIAVRDSDRTVTVAGGSVQEILGIYIVSDPNCFLPTDFLPD